MDRVLPFWCPPKSYPVVFRQPPLLPRAWQRPVARLILPVAAQNFSLFFQYHLTGAFTGGRCTEEMGAGDFARSLERRSRRDAIAKRFCSAFEPRCLDCQGAGQIIAHHLHGCCFSRVAVMAHSLGVVPLVGRPYPHGFALVIQKCRRRSNTADRGPSQRHGLPRLLPSVLARSARLLSEGSRFMVRRACGGRQAVDLWRKHRPDVTLLERICYTV